VPFFSFFFFCLPSYSFRIVPGAYSIYVNVAVSNGTSIVQATSNGLQIYVMPQPVLLNLSINGFVIASSSPMNLNYSQPIKLDGIFYSCFIIS